MALVSVMSVPMYAWHPVALIRTDVYRTHREAWCGWSGDQACLSNACMPLRQLPPQLAQLTSPPPCTHREAWKILLGLYKPRSTSAERQALMRSRQERYLALRQQWQSITAEQAGKNSKWRERKTRVDKDVRRTDR